MIKVKGIQRKQIYYNKENWTEMTTQNNRKKRKGKTQLKGPEIAKRKERKIDS
jgi:hypothetical protein